MNLFYSKTNNQNIIKSLLSILFTFGIFFVTNAQRTTITYDFESDASGSAPANITAANGTLTVDADVSRTNTMNPLTVTTDNVATFNMDLFPVTADYSVTWKETYATAGRSGFILRSFGSNSYSSGLQQGYLFQANPSLGHARIYISKSSGFTTLSSQTLAAPGVNTPRWYRATVDGGTLTFEYSDDGNTFTQIDQVTDTTYVSAGSTQYNRGYSASITGSYVDDIIYKIDKSITYDFESDTSGSAPANITAANGTLTVDADVSRTNTMNPLTVTTDNVAAFNMDLFPVTADYSVTWKETYATAGRSGFILRSFGSNSYSFGLQQGYLFQANPSLGHARIYISKSSGFTTLSSQTLAALGVNTPRWYRATVDGSTLTFEYSDDGNTFTQIDQVTDTTYASAGSTQYNRGYSASITGSYVDDIIYNPLTLPSAIEVNSVKEYQVFQRNSSNESNILISGTYTGTPTEIEASYNGGAFVTIDASPSSGTFSGTLSAQSAGQGDLIVRYKNDTSISVSISNVGIGDIFIIAGQSNASGRGINLNSYSHSYLKASLFGNDDNWKELADITDSDTNQVDAVSKDGTKANGSVWPILATSILANTGVPVAFVPTALGGSRIEKWLPKTDHSDASSLYGSMNRRITAVGGVVAGVLFFQGESDAQNSIDQATYETGLNVMVDAIAADFPETKTMIGQIGRNGFGRTTDAIRAGQINVINTNENAILGPITYDINLRVTGGDGLHFMTDEHMTEFARRWYRVINEYFYNGSDGKGCVLDEDNLIYDRTHNKIIVPFTDESSPAINSSSTVTASSFELHNNSVSVAISAISISGNTIEITPSVALDVAQPITLTYASLNTAVDAAIYDSNNLPAQPFYNKVVNTSVYKETWVDFGNSAINTSFEEVSAQDVASVYNYDYTSDSPTIPLAPDATLKKAFKFIKNAVSTSGTPNLILNLNGTLKDEAITANRTVKVKVSYYIVADVDGSTGTNLSAIEKNGGGNLQFACQILSSTATDRSSNRPSSGSMDFNLGWNELEFDLTVGTSNASNLNEYNQVRLTFGSTTTESASGKKYYTDGLNFIDEEVIIYIGSITSDTALDLSTTWDADTDSDWSTADNWSTDQVPNSLYDVSIPSGVATYPIISSTAGASTKNLTVDPAGSLTVDGGGSLIVSGTSTGNITYKRTLTKDAGLTNAWWYSVSSPVTGENLTTMQANNNFAAGSAGNRIGLATYKNDGTNWTYFTTGSSDPLSSGTGLTAKLNNGVAGNDLSFTGTYTTGPVEPTISQATNNFNFIGNPYMSYLNLGTFFTDNNATDRLSEATIWIWDENLNGTNMGGYVQKMSGTDAAFEIAPGQGFFVSSGSATSNKVTFSTANQSHKTDSFLKSENSRTEIKLSVKQDDLQHQTSIYYIKGTSTDFDNGFDGSLFGGVGYDLALYTSLVENNQGEKLGIQSLPNSGFEEMVIPIGLIAKANSEVSFSSIAQNLPTGLNVYLEDRLLNTFTNLNDLNSNYKVLLTNDVDGTGRFYIHTAFKALSTENTTLTGITIYKTNNTTLRINGLQNSDASVEVFNILGKQVLKESFTANGIKDISLPNLASGIYIIQLQKETGKLSKKIILE